MSLDPRTTLARPDLATLALEGIAPAAGYRAPETFATIAVSAAISRSPDPAAEQMDQLLLGELFDVLESADGFAWGQARRDGYVGFVEAAALAPAGPAPTHRVAVLRTFAFASPSIKAPTFGPVSLNVLVAIEEEQGNFARDGAGHWFWRAHLAMVGRFETDPAEVALRFLGAPYVWGGRDSLGLDCSGLTQQALYACGLACPRDTDQQALLGREVPVDQLARGDLVFWRGHVGLMLDETRLLHANAHHMATAIEPLAEAISRIEARGYGGPSACRRL